MKKSIQSIVIVFILFSFTAHAQWSMRQNNLLTDWGKQVTPDNAWQEYPRPQLERAEWKNLNGLWDYAVVPNSQDIKPKSWDGQILVPFSIETQLSGVGREVSDKESIWYRRSFEVPTTWKGKSLLLHFESSDFETMVWLNGKFLGSHRGGYDPFEFDISKAILGSNTQELVVKVFDPQLSVFKSSGKQMSSSLGYERCSGLWQTVWIEPVSAEASIISLKINTTLDNITLQTSLRGKSLDLKVKYEIFNGNSLVASATSSVNDKVSLKVPSPKLWSPESPFLYNIKVSLIKDSQNIDEVRSYCGIRTVSLSDSPNGRQILLNGNPIFQIGPLDQNYWPGGGLTPPSDAALIWEAEYLKRIGCNMVRLHIKQNLGRFYYHCDRYGLLVWQDFISAQRGNRNPEPNESDFWINEQKQMIEKLYNHPSIIMWVIFNESWGQHDSQRIFDLVETLDTTRLLSIASGWIDMPGVGDIRVIHDYTFRPAIPVPGTVTIAIVLGECGGFVSSVPPHNWTGRSNQSGKPSNSLFGGFNPEIPRDDNTKHDIFRPTFTYGDSFENQYSRFVDQLQLLQNSGLRAAIYTQMTDMKLEENGWLTFDRKVSKIDPDRLGNIHRRLFTAPPVQTILLPSSLNSPQSWEAAEILMPNVKETQEENALLDAALIQKNPSFESLKWKRVKGPFGNTVEPKPGMQWDVLDAYANLY